MHACPKYIYSSGSNVGSYTVHFMGQIGEPSLLEEFKRVINLKIVDFQFLYISEFGI